MVQSGVPLCNTCGEQVGLNDNGEVFVACHQCNFPICKDCFEHELNEDHRVCMKCGTPYEGKPLLISKLLLSAMWVCSSCHASHLISMQFYQKMRTLGGILHLKNHSKK